MTTGSRLPGIHTVGDGMSLSCECSQRSDPDLKAGFQCCSPIIRFDYANKKENHYSTVVTVEVKVEHLQS